MTYIVAVCGVVQVAGIVPVLVRLAHAGSIEGRLL